MANNVGTELLSVQIYLCHYANTIIYNDFSVFKLYREEKNVLLLCEVTIKDDIKMKEVICLFDLERAKETNLDNQMNVSEVNAI